jgi:hypothetical protein
MEITQEQLDTFNNENKTVHTLEGWERSKKT